MQVVFREHTSNLILSRFQKIISNLTQISDDFSKNERHKQPK